MRGGRRYQERLLGDGDVLKKSFIKKNSRGKKISEGKAEDVDFLFGLQLALSGAHMTQNQRQSQLSSPPETSTALT